MRLIILLIGLAVFLQTVSTERFQSSSTRETEVLNKILTNTAYSKHVMPPPTFETGPVRVNLSVYVLNLDVDSKNMEIGVDMYFRQRWTDVRLKQKSGDDRVKDISFSDASLIWTPDVLLPNALKTRTHKQLHHDNTFVKINIETGEVYTSSRIYLKLECPMDVKNFPFDSQTCALKIESYGRTANDLEFFWGGENAVAVNSHLYIKRFTLSSFTTKTRTIKVSSGNYSEASIELVLKREASYYLIQVYIPCVMLIIVSWLSFWIGIQNLQTRVHITLISLITLALSVTYLNSQWPEVSYTKAIDVWTGVSLTFIFAALIETILVNFLYGNPQKAADSESSQQPGSNVVYNSVNKPERQRNPDANFMERLMFDLKQGNTNILDLLSRVLFPLVFILFVLIYICFYC